ncbi:MAG: TolC family protein [Acidobacteria bacterium]|nr:TolC family protein [Acidobacteriota bacterium]
MTKMRILTTFFCLLALGAAAQAPEEREPEEARAIRLTLDEAVRTAAAENLGVSIQDYQYREARQGARATESIFDWFTEANYRTSHDESPVTSAIFSPVTDIDRANIGVRQTLPTGADYSIFFNNSKVEQNNPFQIFNPSYDSDFQLAFNQPLLRNFGVDVTTRNIRIARNNMGLSREEFRRVLMDTILLVDRAYYDLIFARENLEVKRQSLDLARDQARITQIRIDVGASAPLDILQPEVAIATREEEVIIAEAQVRDAEDRLRALMNLPPDQWDRPIVPVTELDAAQVRIDSQEAVALAFELRPELRQANLRTTNSRIQHLYLRNQRLPQLDLALGYGFAGVGGTQIRDPITREPIDPIGGGFGDAFDQVAGLDFPSWSVGFNFGLPIRNIGARAEARRAEFEVERQLQSEERLRQDIAVEVRQAARDMERYSKQIVAARAAREAAERNLDAERKRFDNGMTTNFEVLRVQQDLSDAQSREIAAMVLYNQAISAYHNAVGDLLDHKGISLDVPDLDDPMFSSWRDVRWLNYGYWAD